MRCCKLAHLFSFKDISSLASKNASQVYTPICRIEGCTRLPEESAESRRHRCEVQKVHLQVVQITHMCEAQIFTALSIEGPREAGNTELPHVKGLSQFGVGFAAQFYH